MESNLNRSTGSAGALNGNSFINMDNIGGSEHENSGLIIEPSPNNRSYNTNYSMESA
jgi:hypothetical protein